MLKAVKQPKTVTNKSNLTDFKSQEDVYGSYTGVDAFDKYEKPVQDADDL